MGQIWALLLLEVADKPVLPFDMEDYAMHLDQYVGDLEDFVRAREKAANVANALNLKSLHEGAAEFKTEAHAFHDWDRAWTELVVSSGGFEDNVMAIKRMSHNNRMANFETHLLDLEDGGGVCCYHVLHRSVSVC